MVVQVSEDIMLKIGLNQVGFFGSQAAEEAKLSRFKSMFGVSPSVCSQIFHDIQAFDLGTAKIDKPIANRFLMSIFWLKRYPVETVTAGTFNLDEDTVRKWVWKYCEALQALRSHKILWYDDQNNQEIESWLLSVDGTHCRIREPRKTPDKDLYSHKHHKPCYSYEIGVDLFENKIVWVSGPHKGGESDLQIFRKVDGLKNKLPANKKAIGDLGYRGEPKVSIPNTYDAKDVNIFKRRARARQESLNSRLKNFEVLADRFRHPLSKHQTAFEAVCVLVQYALETDSVLFPV